MRAYWAARGTSSWLSVRRPISCSGRKNMTEAKAREMAPAT